VGCRNAADCQLSVAAVPVIFGRPCKPARFHNSASSTKRANSRLQFTAGSPSVRHAGSEGGEGVAGRTGVTRRRERLLSQFRERSLDPREDRSLSELRKDALCLHQLLDGETTFFLAL